MDDYRASYATAGEVTALWRMISSLREQVATLTERLEGLERGGVGSGPEPASLPVGSRSGASGAS